MLGSKNRDYKTEDRAIRRRLALHSELMNKYIAEGITKEEASKRAFEEVVHSNINGKAKN